MTTEIKRPLSLTPSVGSVIGNERSQQIVQDAYDEGFNSYCELINDGWLSENALRTGHMVLVGTLQAKVHQLAAEADCNE